MTRREFHSRPPPAHTDVPRPVLVGIGASAGALGALQTLFQHVPLEAGIAWVVVTHLSPEHESHLTDLLRSHTRLPIQQVTGTVPIQPDHIYVIPPGAQLAAVDGHLRAIPLTEREHARAPIDHFFRSAAASHDGNAVGVLLTGTGTDGTLGLLAIRERGGLTIVQAPEEAEYDAMPRSAIAAGAADLVLLLREIPAEIAGWAKTRPELPAAEPRPSDETDRLLTSILALIQTHTGHDLSGYKRSTVIRRVRRRMQLHHLEYLAEYLDRLRSDPPEVSRLFDDLLINVTEFFRDREVFEQLARNIVPRLFERKGPDDRVRVWSVGCATGEEAYSLGMLLFDERDRRRARTRIQVFATDLHEPSLGRAREGLYPASIEETVPNAYLTRFFTREDGRGYLARVLPYRSSDNRIEGVVLTFVDITERKAAEEALRRAKEQAERSAQDKARFISTLSHELKTPLNAIIGTADLLARGVLGPITDPQKNHLVNIQTAAWHLVAVIDQILEYSRGGAGQETARAETTDAAAIARGVAELLAASARAKGLELRLTGADAPIPARTDPDKLRRILLNLLGNAIKFTERGYVELALAASPDVLEFRVTDTGPGIPPEQIERIFEPFVRLEGTETPTGTGLGLAVARQLGRLLGGDIYVASAPGHGSTFTVRIRRRLAPPELNGAPPHAPPRGDPGPHARDGQEIVGGMAALARPRPAPRRARDRGGQRAGIRNGKAPRVARGQTSGPGWS